MTREEFEIYYAENLEASLDWYGAAAERLERKSRRLQWSAALLTTLATIVAALPRGLLDALLTQPNQQLLGEAGVRFLVVILSAFSAFTMSILARNGLISGYRIREEGRAEVTNVAQKAKIRLLQIPMTDKERVAYQEKIADELLKIEKKYGGPTEKADPKTK